MWDIYFGEWRDGRLKRLPYFGYDILLMVISIAIVFGIFMLIGGFDNNISSFASSMLEGSGILMIIFIFLFVITLTIANLNIMAKRIRDMGLPGWKTVLGVIVFSMIIGALFPAQQMEVNTAVVDTADGISGAINADASNGNIVSSIMNLIIFAALVFIPSDTFGKKDLSLES